MLATQSTMAQPSTERDDRTAAASYVATLTADLASIAKTHGLDTLGYILDMARLEAENVARGSTGRS
jgi:hypothetical protein